MIEIVSNRLDIEKFQRLLVKALKNVCTEKIQCSLGHKGESHNLTVFYSKDYNFWFCPQDYPQRKRFWNSFGFGKPIMGKNNSITVEVNIPYKGIDRRVGGVFGSNENGDILIMHRGTIGGGRIGIGQQLFLENIRDTPLVCIDGNKENPFFLVGELTSKYLPIQVANFVSEVHRIKNLTENEISEFSELNNFSFSDEPIGKRVILKSGQSTIDRTHGIVVNLLARILEKKGYQIAKNRNIDLFIHNNGTINKLFEIKRSSSTQSLHTGVGQLLIYSIPIKSKIELILVLPDKINDLVENKLLSHNIKILYYDWNNGEPKFKYLSKIL